MQDCPCGSGKTLDHCCDMFISGQQLPTTPEELMRSRYTAYTQANVEYIAKTMKAPANKDFNPDYTRDWSKRLTWLKLEIVKASMENEIGYVEFLAHFSENNKRFVMHEISEFHRENDQWYYVDGKEPEKKPTFAATKIARNDPCPCGSSKKYKKCCGNIP